MTQSIVGEEVPYATTVFFTVNDDGTIMKVETEQMAGGALTGWPSGVGAKLATAYTALRFPDSVRVDATGADSLATVRARAQEFVYLDCGRWGGPMSVGGPGQRCFGVVWGPWAALCEFHRNDSYATDQHLIIDQSTGRPVVGSPINELLVQLRGSGGASVKLVKALWSSTPNSGNQQWTPDWNTIYVVLPDLHLPVSILTGSATGSDGKAMGRLEYSDPYDATIPPPPYETIGRSVHVTPDDEGMVTDPMGAGHMLGDTARQWFARYRAGDIFGVPGSAAAADMVEFARRLSAAAHRSRIHFVQVGDMYDLWIGLIAFFDERSTDTVSLGDRNGIRAGNFIDLWCARTNDLFDKTVLPGAGAPLGMISSLVNLPVKEKSWLWGNHDNYLAVHTPAGLPQRIKEVRRNGVYIEHGQRADPDNHDGTLSGQGKTNSVFKIPSLRALDPTRRGYFTSGAAASYVRKPDFAVYVMGHTHMPYLTRVQINVQRHVPPPPPRNPRPWMD